MPMISAFVDIDDVLNRLDLSRADLPDDCRFPHSGQVEVEVEVSQRDIDAEATIKDRAPELIEVNDRDLRDGVRAILVGDFAMARALLLRALEGHDDCRKVIEEEMGTAIGAARAKQRRPMKVAH